MVKDKALQLINKGTSKVLTGVSNRAKGAIKRGFEYCDDGIRLLNKFSSRSGVNSGVGSLVGSIIGGL